MVAAGALAFAAALLLHIVFSCRLRVEYGSPSTAHPRHRLPLAAIPSPAGLWLLGGAAPPPLRTRCRAC